MSDDDKTPDKDMPAPFEEATEEEKQQFAEVTSKFDGGVRFLPVEFDFTEEKTDGNPLTLEQDQRATALYHAVSAAERMRGTEQPKGPFQSGGKKEITSIQVIRLAKFILNGDDL